MKLTIEMTLTDDETSATEAYTGLQNLVYRFHDLSESRIPLFDLDGSIMVHNTIAGAWEVVPNDFSQLDYFTATIDENMQVEGNYGNHSARAYAYYAIAHNLQPEMVASWAHKASAEFESEIFGSETK